MWLRKTVHKVAPEGIVYRGVGDDGHEVLMCEVLAGPGDEELWARLLNNTEEGLWGLVDVQKLPSGRHLLVSDIPAEWSSVVRTRPSEAGTAESFNSAEQFIRIRGELISLPLPWFQHPGQSEQHQQTPTLPTPLVRRVHLPLLEKTLLPAAVVLVAGGWLVFAWML